MLAARRALDRAARRCSLRARRSAPTGSSGYRRGRFSLALEPLEALAVFLVLHVAPGDPFLPLLGLAVPQPLRRAAARVRPLRAVDGRAVRRARRPRRRAVRRPTSPAPWAPRSSRSSCQALLVALRASEIIQRRLTSIVQNSTDVVTIVGADQRIRWQAESIRGVLGHEPDAIVGTRLHDLVHADDRARARRLLRRRRRPARTTRRNLTLRLAHGDGGHRHFDVVAANRLHDPSVAGYVLNMRDATDRRELEHELRSLAAQREHDAHARPADRPRQPAQAVRRASTRPRPRPARRKTKLALLLIDLDHFKELNDTLGHQAGDRLLREIGPRLEAGVPGAELVARVGGDEFAVLLPLGTTVEEAEVVAARARAARSRSRSASRA